MTAPTQTASPATPSGDPRPEATRPLRETLQGLAVLPPDAVDAIIDIAEIRALAPGEVLFAEGLEDNTLFVVLEGTLGLSRRALHSDLPLGTVGPGDLLGQLSFLDASTRQVTARAGDHPVQVAVIDPMELLLLPNGDSHYDVLRAGLIVPVVRTSRAQSKALVVAMEERQRFSGFFIYMIAVLYGCMLIYYLVAERFVEDTTTNLFAWQSAAVLVIPSLFVVYRLGLTRADLGLRTEDFARSLKWGAIWGAAIATAFVGTFQAVRLSGGMPDFERVQAFELLDMVLYFPHTFIQEFVARGIIQNGYQRFFDDEKGYRSVGFASLVFAVAHIPVGLLAVVLTFVGGIIFGLFFLRYKHLIGVTLVHYALGASAIALGLI